MKYDKENQLKVPRSQWKKWSKTSRNVFENLFLMMEANPQLFNHPSAPTLSGKEWKTTCWNAAWMAADFVQDEIKRLQKVI